MRWGGSVDGYGDFATARAGHLYRSACLLTAGDTHLAEDLVQETLGRVYVRRGRVSRADNPAGYAQTVLTPRVPRPPAAAQQHGAVDRRVPRAAGVRRRRPVPAAHPARRPRPAAREGREKGAEGVVMWTVDTLRPDGGRVVISAFDSGSQHESVTRAAPALTMKELRAVALAPEWDALL